MMDSDKNYTIEYEYSKKSISKKCIAEPFESSYFYHQPIVGNLVLPPKVIIVLIVLKAIHSNNLLLLRRLSF